MRGKISPEPGPVQRRCIKGTDVKLLTLVLNSTLALNANVSAAEEKMLNASNRQFLQQLKWKETEGL